MPVRELTDRPRQMPRLGKIRLGDQSGTNNAPKNLPYFVVPEEVAAVYGENPTELPIVFLSDDEEVIASSYYRAYNASNGLVCKGDGFNANAMLDAAVLHRKGGVIDQPLDINVWAHGATRGDNVPATKDVVRQEIDCWGSGYDDHPPCPMYALKKCAVRSFFQFAIYGVPGLGVYQMDTGSQINVGRMLGTLAMARSVLGGISGVPMILSREKTDVAPTGTKHGVYTVNLRIDTKFSLTEVLKLRAGPVANALLPPVDESEVYLHVGDEEPLMLTEPPNAQDIEHEEPAAPESVAGQPTAPPASPATEEQLATIADWTEQLKQSAGGATKLKAVDATRREWFPDGVDPATNRWSSARLTEEQATAYVALLRESHEGVAEAQQPSMV